MTWYLNKINIIIFSKSSFYTNACVVWALWPDCTTDHKVAQRNVGIEFEEISLLRFIIMLVIFSYLTISWPSLLTSVLYYNDGWQTRLQSKFTVQIWEILFPKGLLFTRKVSQKLNQDQIKVAYLNSKYSQT